MSIFESACLVDWPKAATVTKEIVIALAAIISAIVAVLGINAWRRQLSGKASFDTMQELMSEVYKWKKIMITVRSAQIFTSEMHADSDHLSKEDGVATRADMYSHVLTERWCRVNESLGRIEAASYRAMALIGFESLDSAVGELRGCSGEWLAAVDAYVADMRSGGDSFRKNPELGLSSVAALWNRQDTSNHLSKRINNAVSKMESITKPYLR